MQLDTRNIEQGFREGVPDKGWPEDFLIGRGNLTDKSGLILTATTDPDLVVMAGGVFGIKWDHGGAAADFCSIAFQMPHQWAKNQRFLKLVLPARKLDAAADENADLMLQAQIRWFRPGRLSNPSQTSATGTVPTAKTSPVLHLIDSALQSLTTPAKAMMAAATIAAANTAPAGFFEYELDIGARLIAEGKFIKPGSWCTIEFGPNETVGATDMDLEVGMPVLRWSRHTSFLDQDDRKA